jgi:hypothetical protein
VNAEEQKWKWLRRRRRRRNDGTKKNMERQKMSKISKIRASVDEFFLCMHNSKKKVKIA